MRAALKAFREPALISDTLQLDGDFADFEHRRLRYEIYWRFFENTAYRDIHSYATRYKIDYGLYKYIRSIYNPAYRLGEFWKAHLWGGALDPEAGDGRDKPSALPIATENSALAPAIAQIWQWSNWQIKKDVAALWGPVLGDVGLMVVDDQERQKVYLQIVHPGTIREVEKDPFGNIKGYVLEEEREDPRNKTRTVTYTEMAQRDGDNVVYTTLLDGKLYDWSGNGAEWEIGYGFIPLVLAQHNDVGLDWGWAEIHPMRSRIHEADDQASLLNDQIRKEVNPFLVFFGVDKPSSTPRANQTSYTTGSQQDIDHPYPGREDINALYGDVGGKVENTNSDLNIAAVSSHIMELLKDLEENLPELQVSKRSREASGEKSGKALREVRRDAQVKVEQRRAGYDDALVRAQQMALAIAGMRGYDGFDGLSLESFAAGDLDHSIGERPVFANDPLDDLELLEKKFVLGEIPRLSRWRMLGFSDEDIDLMKQEQEEAMPAVFAETGDEGEEDEPDGEGDGDEQET